MVMGISGFVSGSQHKAPRHIVILMAPESTNFKVFCAVLRTKSMTFGEKHNHQQHKESDGGV